MKDKLSKNGHKGLYYQLRKFFLGAVISASLVAAIGIPTYIVIQNNLEKQTLADQNDDEGDTQDDSEDVASYNDDGGQA